MDGWVGFTGTDIHIYDDWYDCEFWYFLLRGLYV